MRFEPTAYFTLGLRGACLAKRSRKIFLFFYHIATSHKYTAYLHISSADPEGVAHEAISPRWSVKPSLKFLYIDKVISIVFLSSCLDPPLYLQLKEFYRLVMKIKIISFFVFAYLMFLQLFLQLLFHFLFLVL